MESVRHGRRAVKADRLQKHKGEGRESRLACRFPVVLAAILTARLRHERVTKADMGLQHRQPYIFPSVRPGFISISMFIPPDAAPGPCEPTPSTSNDSLT